MKKHLKIIIPLVVVFGLVGGVAFYFNQLSKNGILDMEDVYATIKTLSVYFIPVAILVVAIIIALIVFRKKDRTFKFWLRAESLVAVLVALVITANVIVFGPMASLFNLNYAKMGTVSKETLANSANVTNKIADEGIVLLKNNEEYLPLKEEKRNLNVFGWASTNPVYGGTGSGNVDTSTAVTMLDGLKNGGFKVNTELVDFYTDYRSDRPEVGMWAQDWTLPEPKKELYSEELLNNAKEFSETAVIFIGRVGGEGADLPMNMKDESLTYEGNEGDFEEGDHFLELSKSEKELVDLVTANFDDVVVVINAANAMELGWIEEYDNIKSALWMAGPGTTGFNSLGNVLNGSVNPSGRTVNTYVYDLQKTPTWNNFGDFQYEDSEYTFVNYVEDIYVGYKFYETFYEGKEEAYQKAVQYPFGYGLSYAKFNQEMNNFQITADGKVTFDVTVTNEGEYSGKDVVQAYYTAPYQEGGIEKASTNLVAFEKTNIIEPGESQTITMAFNQEEMASYNAKDGGAYVLDAGEYKVQIKADAHTILDEETYNSDTTVIFDATNKRASDEVAATNQFDYAFGEVTYLSRKNNFENYEDVTKRPEERALTALESDGLMNDTNYVLEELDVEMPKTNAKNDKKLADYRGMDYADPSWEELLDQLTIKDMSRIVTFGGYQTIAAKSVEKVQAYDFDGPAGISSFFMALNGSAFPTATMIAATWNAELAKERGEAIGAEANEIGISGWYGPGMNIQRSAFAGRNFEYYSEDALLSGAMAANEIAGAKSKGVYSFMKHFALNDQETNRTDFLLTWSTEQAMREIYLKPFEVAVKEGGANAAMSAFNYIGNRWAGADSQLLNTVLRDEWGFDGFVSTDYFGGYGYMSGDMAVRNGGDTMLSTNGENGASLEDTSSATAVASMRRAAHNVMYTVVNSSAYDKEDVTIQPMPWEKTMMKINIALIASVLLIQGLFILWYMKRIRPSANK